MLNLGPFTAVHIALGLKPITGPEGIVYFSLETCQRLGYIRCDAPDEAVFVSEGGAALPAAGRVLVARVTGNGAQGAGGAMTVTFGATLHTAGADTITATFDIPQWAPDQTNFFPFGAGRNFIPDTPANVDYGVITLGALDSVANMTAGNRIEIFSVPALSSFVEIVGCTGKPLTMDGPSQMGIPDRYDPQRWTKLSRGQLREVSLGFRGMGPMQQLARYNAREGTLRIDILKEEQVIWNRYLFNGFVPNISGDLGDEDVLELTAAGTFSDAFFGYGDSE